MARLSDAAVELSVVIPCLNEAKTIEACVLAARDGVARYAESGEVIVADNGSTDGSRELARAAGATVVEVPVRGYGSALLAGIGAARGRFVVMGDADDTYDLRELGGFLDKLRSGVDLVMGDRFRGGIEPGAMPPLHKYVGNPLLSLLGRVFFRTDVRDFHSGIRAFRRDSILALDLRTTGMEFASEMVVKSALRGLRIDQVPVTLRRDRRGRPPHLRTWRDGWRHLRFLLLYSPRWLFLYPGALLMLGGGLVTALLLPGPKAAGAIGFDVHTLIYSAIAIVIGFQAVAFAILTKVFAVGEGLLPRDPRLDRAFQYVTLETGLIVGAALLAVGGAGAVWAVTTWQAAGFGALDDTSVTLRIVIASSTALALGVQVVLASFFLSILGLRRR
ncbi:MAG TPA: glycosyltransferase family 2 protein [Candidatus Limnocylindria bacterium]|nr:glycosyltransferase family 2 protein [Candidatus Limnocylindria bacterium]